MKKLLLIIAITISLFSCSTSPVKDTILKHEQTFEGTFTDLNMKILDIEHIGTITVKDSMNIINKEFISFWHGDDYNGNDNTTCSDAIAEINETINSQKELIELYDETNNYVDKYEAEENLEQLEGFIETLERIKASSEKYASMSEESVLVESYNCSYTIENPFLNNVKQTVTKTYYITPDAQKVVSSEQSGA